ncbi:uncharacterized protein [Chanodichthys erythropterus]|uniref:uncharacterized protein isoform X4 n=1 Tax=Chanodichthys erythropterus TaxID=933992 RepID=UPI00351EBFAB
MASSSGNRSQQRQHKYLPDKEGNNMTAGNKLVHSERKNIILRWKNKFQRGCGSLSLERPNMSDLRIVLLGKNITENNRVGNFILGRAAFESEAPADVELNIEKHRGKLKDRDVTVINAPHLLRPNLSITQITQGVKECVNLSAPGPHVIILVLQQNDFNDNDRNRVKYVLNKFSKEALKHTLVLTDEREINNNAIHQLIKECGGEHLQFDERKSGLHSEILERVEKILKENQDQFLIYDLYEEAGEETPEDGEKRRSGGSVTAEEEGDFDHEDDGKIKQRNKEKKEVAVQSKTLFMASSNGPALNEELQCSICLEVFTDPVTTPCGHNFCRSCLSECWTNTQTCFCPLCNERFSRRPDLKINTTLVKLVQHFNKLNQESKVFCDICDERKQKAVKSCLTCQSSYCDDHLEPHHRVPRLKKHTLINAVKNLEDYICQKHERPLEMFCRDDQMCVCLFCTEGEHRTHNTVPIEEESREKKTQTDEQQMIQKRMKKIQEIKHSVKQRKTLISNDCFLTSSRTIHISNLMIIGLGVLLVAALIILPKQYTRCQPEQLKMKEQQKKEAEKQGEDLIKELQQEITELKKRDTEQEKRNTGLEKRNTELEKRNTELEKRNTELEKRNTELEKRNTELEKRNTELEKRNTGLEKRNTELEKRNTELEKRNTELEKRNTELEKRNTELEKRNTELEKRNTELEKRNTELEKRNTELEKRNTEQEKRNTELEKRNTELEKRNTELEKRNTELEKRNTEQEKRNTELEKRNTELEKRNTELEKRNTGLEKRNTEQEKRNTELEKRNTELEKRNTELEKRNIEQVKRNTELEKRNTELEKRNTELEKRNTELEKRNSELSQTDGHLHLIQMYLNTLSHSNDSDVNSLKRALTELKEQLKEKLTQTELKFVQKFAVDVTLDPDTAYPYLILSDDGKQVSHGDIKQDAPENPKRFYVWFCVLAKQGFSSGRFYYEVQVKGKTGWELGVARESISRKDIWLCPENGYWTVTHWNENQYAARESPSFFLSLTVKPEKVGVFVDYEEGLVSFYDVDSRSLIYSFTGQTFTDKLYPYFNPFLNYKGKNSNPLIITPVN